MSLPGPQEYALAKALFLRALDQPQSERAAFLQAACPTDDALRDRAQRLLNQHFGDVTPGTPDRQIAPDLIAPDLFPDGQIGAYRLLGVLGRGGMGVVYHAEHETTGEEVAVKILRLGTSGQRARLRIEREMEVLRRLEHPGICVLRDSGEIQSGLGRLPWFAMELVDGEPLHRYAEREALDTRGRLRMIADVCEIVQHAHDQQIVHRDLKPSNLLADSSGRPHVLDFGIARLTAPEQSLTTLTTESHPLLGTVRYMSPEQVLAEPDAIDARSDVWSLGVVAYELLVGRTPFGSDGDTLPELLSAVLARDPDPPSNHDSSIPPEVDAILDRAMRRETDDRYPSARAFAADIGRWLHGLPLSPAPPRRPVTGSAAFAQQAAPRPLISRRQVLLGGPLFLGGAAAWFTRESWVPTSQETRLARLYGLLDEADQRIHFRDRTQESQLEAVDMLLQGKEILREMMDLPFAPLLFRYIDFRLGEAHLFLGFFGSDPGRFEQAYVHYGSSASIFSRNEGTLEGFDSGGILESRVARLQAHHPTSGQAHSMEALAGYRRPTENLELALGFRWIGVSSPPEWREGPPPNALSLPRPALIRFHDLAGTMTRLARLERNRERAVEALRWLRPFDGAPNWSGSWPPWSSFLYTRGLAEATLAEIDGDDAGFLVADEFFAKSLDVRGSQGGTFSAEIRFVRSEVLLERALSVQGQDTEPLLARAEASARAGLQQPDLETHAYVWAQAHLALARVLVARATRAHAGPAPGAPPNPELDEAARALQIAEDFAAGRAPRLLGEVHLVQAQMAAAQNDPDSAEAALRRLATTLSPSEYPRLFHQMRTLEAALPG